MSVIVYTLPACVQCDTTKRTLKKKLIEFSEVRLDQDASAYEYVLSLGYTAAPVVVAGEDHWSGFRIDKINSLI